MSNHHIDPSDNSGATRNLNNYVAKQVVAQALGLNTKPSPMEIAQAEAAGTPPILEAEPVLVYSTVAPAPESEEASLPPASLPPRQYPGEAQLMAAILDWQRNLRKELEADNLAEPTLSETEPGHIKAANEPDIAVQLPEQAREFGLLTRADVQAEPSAIPLIHGWISKGQLTMIAGPSGSGKSVFQLHLGAALLNAPKVFGHAIPKRARFLYVNLEGDLKPRLEAIEQHHPGWSFPAPEALFMTRAWRLNIESEVVELARRVTEAGGVDVIFIDTLNRAIPGSDENLSTDMGVVIKHSNRLIELTGAAVVLTHHTGKAKERGPRGHSSLYAALDTCIMVDQAESGLRTIELVKTRQGAGGDMRYFSIENIALGEDDYGLPMVGPALTEVEGSPEVEKAANATALTPQQKEALLALSLHMQNGLKGELQEEISRDEALEVVKLAFSAVSTKHRSTRAREAIDALIEGGKLQQKESGMLTIGS